MTGISFWTPYNNSAGTGWACRSPAVLTPPSKLGHRITTSTNAPPSHRLIISLSTLPSLSQHPCPQHVSSPRVIINHPSFSNSSLSPYPAWLCPPHGHTTLVTSVPLLGSHFLHFHFSATLLCHTHSLLRFDCLTYDLCFLFYHYSLICTTCGPKASGPSRSGEWWSSLTLFTCI